MDSELKSRIPLLDDPAQFNFACEILNNSPPVVMLRDILTREECQHFIDRARPLLKPSTMAVDNKEVVRDGRNSHSAFITKNKQKLSEEPIIYKLFKRLSLISGMPITHFEKIKIVNYKKGQRYYPHYDFFRDQTKFTERSGDRIMTFLVYLNTLPIGEGGYTTFPNLGLKIRPEEGAAIFWTNMDFDGNYFDDTLHSGEEVQREKWAINVWIRERPCNDYVVG